MSNFKKKQREQGLSNKKKREESEDSSSSEDSQMLDNLTENSRYSSLNEFQNVIRDKIVDIKVSASEKHNSFDRVSWKKQQTA